jgi:hypothetical protein
MGFKIESRILFNLLKELKILIETTLLFSKNKSLF